jgi:hypothetical protein
MGLFGKILAILNVLAAIAFFWIAAADYSQRSQWSYSHFRHQLALHGLPVGNDDNTWRLPGRSIESDLTTNTLNDMFATIPAPFSGHPHKTQVEELNWLLAQIQGEVAGAADIEAKRAVLAKYLIPIQKTGEDRDQVIAQLRSAKDEAGINGLQQRLEQSFKDAVSVSQNNQTRDLHSRRESIADLLFNIIPSNAWHARVQTVVGLEQTAAAADRQAERLDKMAQRLRDAIADERTKFVKDYEILIPELKNLSLDVKRYEQRLAEHKGLVNRYTAMKNARTAEVSELNQKIQAATREVAAETAALQSLEQRLFAAQQQMAAAKAENERLERELRAQEAGK